MYIHILIATCSDKNKLPPWQVLLTTAPVNTQLLVLRNPWDLSWSLLAKMESNQLSSVHTSLTLECLMVSNPGKVVLCHLYVLPDRFCLIKLQIFVIKVWWIFFLWHWSESPSNLFDQTNLIHLGAAFLCRRIRPGNTKYATHARQVRQDFPNVHQCPSVKINLIYAWWRTKNTGQSSKVFSQATLNIILKFSIISTSPPICKKCDQQKEVFSVLSTRTLHC